MRFYGWWRRIFYRYERAIIESVITRSLEKGINGSDQIYRSLSRTNPDNLGEQFTRETFYVVLRDMGYDLISNRKTQTLEIVPRINQL